jgi:hypothetical protein
MALWAAVYGVLGLAQADMQGAGAPWPPQVSGHIKEKLALRTILETKALPLAEDLARSLEASSASEGAAADSRTAKQLAALRHLLSATVKAMSRADAQ